ncbi:5'/3'-nucleotidase SurE [bacterium]|nr:5'/3'-nucleotidase SurE [bacterium]
MLRLLLSNDDGIGEPGLLALARELAPYCELLVIAPDTASSGTSHSITLREPLYLSECPDFVQWLDISPRHLRAYSCSGKPSDCVMLGHFVVAAAQQPHLVLSGINKGCNVAEDMTYSGTIGAALEAAVLGLPAMALSLDSERGGDFEESARLASLTMALMVYGHSFPWQQETLEALRRHSASWPGLGEHFWPLVAAPPGCPEHFPAPPPQWYPELIEHAPCFNVNFPGTALSQVAGISWSMGGVRRYVDAISVGSDPEGRPCFYIGGEKVLQDDDTPGTDTHALSHDYVSVTPITYDLSNRHEAARFREHLAQRMAAGQSVDFEPGLERQRPGRSQD